MQYFENKSVKMRNCFAKFSCIFEFRALHKFVNLVDLEKCCKMCIWLQKSASIQPRTSGADGPDALVPELQGLDRAPRSRAG